MRYHYVVHGLTVESDLRFDELQPHACPNGAEIEIRIGHHGEHSATDKVPCEESASFSIPAVGRYDIAGGRRIIISPEPCADSRDVKLFALGSAMGILLHQRGRFALHASAAVRGDIAIAVTGPSGAGKSTFALRAERLGFSLLSDDLTVIDVDGGQAIAHRALSRMRLCPDALAAVGVAAEQFPLSYPDSDDRRKHDVPILSVAGETAKLRAIVELVDGEQERFDLLSGADAFDCVMANSFRGLMVADGPQKARHFANAVAITKAVAVYRFTRPRRTADLDRQVEAIMALPD